MDAVDSQLEDLVSSLQQSLTLSRVPRMLPLDQFGRRVAHEKMRADRIEAHFCLLLVSAVTPGATSKDEDILGDYLLNRKRLTDELCQLNELSYVLLLPDTSVDGAKSVGDDILAIFDSEITITVISYPSGLFDADDSEDESGDEIGTIPLNDAVAKPLSSWKRFRDIAVSFTSLVILAPAYVVIALIIRSTSRGPAIHRQERTGFAGKPFMMYKFRSMIVDAEEQKSHLLGQSEQDGPAFKIADDPRITKIGRILRKFSIDEFPQLWNVLKGDMTLVGPRPLPTDEAQECSVWQKNRLAVVPGLTCIWQVEGRSVVSFSEWMRMDLRYVHSDKLFRDARLIARTIQSLVVRPNGR